MGPFIAETEDPLPGRRRRTQALSPWQPPEVRLDDGRIDPLQGVGVEALMAAATSTAVPSAPSFPELARSPFSLATVTASTAASAAFFLFSRLRRCRRAALLSRSSSIPASSATRERESNICPAARWPP